MTVLPQLEAELRAAHARRSGLSPRRVIGWVSVAAAVAVVAVVVVVLASVRSGHKHMIGATQPAGGWSRITLRHVDAVSGYAAGGSLYLAETDERSPSSFTLVRTNNPTGAPAASLLLDAQFDGALLAAGCLWVTGTMHPAHGRYVTYLWRLDPESLGVISSSQLPGMAPDGGAVGSIARARGWLWIATSNRLVRVSPYSGIATAVLPIAGARAIDVAADQSGRVLVVSVGNGQGRGQVQRRNPDSGALLRSSAPFEGVTQPALGGVVDGGVWFSEAGGMMGYVGRLSLASLTPTRIEAPPLAYHDIGATVIDGMLWVHSAVGGSQRNYCGNPVTGRPLAVFANPTINGQFQFVTGDNRYIYLAESPVAGNAHTTVLIREPIDPRCR